MDYIIPAFTMLTLDSFYLSNIGGPIFNPMIKNIQGEKITLNIYGAIIVYVLLLFVMYKFIIAERKSPNDAFLLGFCIYGIFDFTNIAIFKIPIYTIIYRYVLGRILILYNNMDYI